MAHEKYLDSEDPEQEPLEHQATFAQVLHIVKKKANVVLNFLDIPMGDSSAVDVPPGFLNIASEEYALNPTKAMVGNDDFRDDLIWSTVSNKHAASTGHIDDMGLCTSTNTMAGGKVWAIETPLSADDDMTHIHAFDHCPNGTFDSSKVCYELVYLPPNCVL